MVKERMKHMATIKDVAKLAHELMIRKSTKK